MDNLKWLPFWTVLRRELYRFWSIKRQTILGPLLETYLYIAIFGAALGSRIDTIDGHDYVIFIIPGLLFMSFAMNIFMNNTGSMMMQKLQRSIDDQLASPVSNNQLLLGYALGGIIRASLIVTIALVTASFLIEDLPMVHPLLFIVSMLLIGLFFSMIGMIVGLRAEKFDDIHMYQTFILQPLIFLGGIFYSSTLLPEPFQTLTHFNPVYYMINTVRYAMLGHANVNPAICLAVIGSAGIILLLINMRLFKTGYRLRS